MLYFHSISFNLIQLNSSYSTDDTLPKGSQMYWVTLRRTTECRISCIGRHRCLSDINLANCDSLQQCIQKKMEYSCFRREDRNSCNGSFRYRPRQGRSNRGSFLPDN